MFATVLSAAVLASTLASPILSTGAQDDTRLVPLVREHLGAYYTLHVQESCPASHPYVHQDGWVGSLPKDVTFLPLYWDGPNRVTGPMTNWGHRGAQVSIDLKCTSDFDQRRK